MPTRETETERLFSEGVDLLLAGGEPRPATEVYPELAEALEFARHMKELRPAPSEEFRNRLQALLLADLAARDAAREARWSWFPQWLRRPVWQAAVVLVVAIVAGVLTYNNLLQPPVVVQAPAPGIELPPRGPAMVAVAGAASKTTYAYGERVGITVSLRNDTEQTLRIDQFPPILSLMRADSREPVYTFRAGNESRILGPNETSTFAVTWNQLDEWGQAVPPGGYYVELEDLDLQGRAVQLVFSRPVTFNISY